MKYVSADGMMAYLGEEDYHAWANSTGNPDRALDDCEARMLAAIIPNVPGCEEQTGAFCRAVYAQLLYESSAEAAQLDGLPECVSSFTVNGFSATLLDRQGGQVSRLGISRTAWAELLNAGLLYRGVITC